MLGHAMKKEKPLKPVQLTALKLIAVGTPLNRVAEKLEVSEMTVYRWRRLPEFESRLRTITSSGMEEIAKKMNAATLTAIETLQETMCDMSEPTNVRLKAALGVLNATASVNGMLEKGLRHRAADFDLQQRWGEGFACNSVEESNLSLRGGLAENDIRMR